MDEMDQWSDAAEDRFMLCDRELKGTGLGLGNHGCLVASVLG